VIFFVAMIFSGVRVYNADQTEDDQLAVSIGSYLTTGDLVEATFENWESEVLQMGMDVVLTAYLFQKGSSESKPIGQRAPQDEDPRTAGNRPTALAGPARKLGAQALRALALEDVLHAASRLGPAARAGGASADSDEPVAHGQPPVTFLAALRHLAVLVRVDADLAE
jgi:hypothetical protein